MDAFSTSTFTSTSISTSTSTSLGIDSDHLSATASMSVIDQFLVSWFLSTGALGVTLNTFLIAVILRNKDLRQSDYIAFILNRTLLDAALCLHSLILQPLGIAYWTTAPSYCIVAASAFNALGISCNLAEGLLAFNRYTAVCRRHLYKSIFVKRYIVVLCVAVWLVGLSFNVPHIFDGSLGRITGMFCGPDLSPAHVLVVGLTDYTTFLLSYAIVLVCYYRIFVTLKRHRENATITTGQQLSRLTEDTSLLRYVGAMALVPLALESPTTVVNVVRMIDVELVHDLLFCASACMYVLVPLTNPVLTLIMVRPIRKEFLGSMRKTFSKNQVVAMETVSVVPAAT